MNALYGAELGRMFVSIFADDSKFRQTIDADLKKMESMGSKMRSIGMGITAAVTIPILGAAAASFKLASDYEESINKIDVAFKDSAQGVKDWSKNTLTQFGLAKGTALDMAAGYGDMATSMGLPTDAAANMSQSLVGLAGDLASFKNIGIDEANTALTAIFTGETESLKRLGIVMTQVNLEEYAASQGIKKKIKDMTQAEQVQLRYNYVMSKTANAQGDFARTGGGAANQMKIFGESLKELGATIGENLLPVFTPIIKGVNDMIKRFGAMSPATQKMILIFAGLAAAVGPVLIVVGSIITAIGTIGGALMKIGGILKGAKLAAMFAAVPLPVLAIAVAIGVVIGAIVYMIKHWDKVKAKFEEVKAAAIRIFNALKQWFWSWGYALLGPFGMIAKVIHDNWDEIKQAGINAFDAVAGAVQWVIDKIQALIQGIKDGIGWLKELGSISIAPTIGRAVVDSGTAVPMMPDVETPTDENFTPTVKDMSWLEQKLNWFDTGGIVPGPLGAPQLAVVHGGEEVLTPAQRQGGGSSTVNHTGTITVKGVNNAGELVATTRILADDFRRMAARPRLGVV